MKVISMLAPLRAQAQLRSFGVGMQCVFELTLDFCNCCIDHD